MHYNLIPTKKHRFGHSKNQKSAVIFKSTWIKLLMVFMVQLKIIFVILTIIAALTSGCINSNEPTQKTQLKDEPKVINLNAQQIVLNDIEVKEILGYEWKNVQTNMIGVTSDNGRVGDGVSVVYDKEPFYEIIWYDISGGRGEDYAKPITVKILVFTNIVEAENYYSKDMLIYSQDSRYFHYKQNKIDIGDVGNIYTVEDLLTIKNPNNVDIVIKIIFRKNNVISIIYFDTEKSNVLNIETATELAKKQEAKIIRILDKIN